jgi:hypothetical protein
MNVKPGQIWADSDPRSAGRTLRVVRVEGGKAVCTVLTNSDATGWARRDMRGTTTRVSVSRMRPTRTGYRLISDTQYGIRWPTGSVFAFGSREEAESELAADGRGIGVLVMQEYEPGTPNATEWREVER